MSIVCIWSVTLVFWKPRWVYSLYSKGEATVVNMIGTVPAVWRWLLVHWSCDQIGSGVKTAWQNWKKDCSCWICDHLAVIVVWCWRWIAGLREQLLFHRESSGGRRKDEAWPLVGKSTSCFLQCFDTVGWLSWAVFVPILAFWMFSFLSYDRMEGNTTDVAT